MLLILDLDETLVFASTVALDRPPDFQVGEYFVYRRPHLEKFLNYASENCQLAVWSSSGADYARGIVENVFVNSSSLVFLWARERCTYRLDPETREAYYVKDLKKVKKLGHDLEQVLIIDDSPEKIERNYGNHLQVRPFEGQADDTELVLLRQYLETIKHVAQLRSLEKRHWRQQVSNSGKST